MIFPKPIEQITFEDISQLLENYGNESIYHDLKLYNAYLIGDKTHKDFKKHEQDLPGDICSLLNQSGGYLLIGIDNQGNICGLENQSQIEISDSNSLRERVSNRLHQVIHQKISPSISGIEIQVISNTRDKKHVILIQIPRGKQKPYACRKNINSSWPYYGRNDQDKIALTPDSIRLLYLENYGIFTDEQFEKSNRYIPYLNSTEK